MNNDYKQQPSGWYAPLTQERREAAGAAEPTPKKKKGMPMGLRIVLGALLVVGLIAGSSLLFGRKEAAPAIQLPEFGHFLPGETLPEQSLPTEDELPEVEKRPTWQMSLRPPGKRKRPCRRSISPAWTPLSPYVATSRARSAITGVRAS